jgi:hypothetical protein
LINFLADEVLFLASSFLAGYFLATDFTVLFNFLSSFSALFFFISATDPVLTYEVVALTLCLNDFFVFFCFF